MRNLNVLYLSTKYSKRENLINFVKYYKKFKPGIKHRLIVCFKNLNNNELKERKKILNKINYVCFVDPSKINDHEFASIRRVSEKFDPGLIFYLSDSAYPIKKNWLKIISSKFKKKRILGCSGSMSSWATNSYYRHHKDNYLNYFYKLIYFNLFVPRFPNPHLRFNGLLFSTSDYLDFIKDKEVRNRMKAYIMESGKKGFTNHFKSKNYDILVVNSDGKYFNEKNWKLSNTYAYKKQDKLLISDHNTRDYLKLTLFQKIKKQKITWG